MLLMGSHEGGSCIVVAHSRRYYPTTGSSPAEADGCFRPLEKKKSIAVVRALNF